MKNFGLLFFYSLIKFNLYSEPISDKNIQLWIDDTDQIYQEAFKLEEEFKTIVKKEVAINDRILVYLSSRYEFEAMIKKIFDDKVEVSYDGGGNKLININQIRPFPNQYYRTGTLEPFTSHFEGNFDSAQANDRKKLEIEKISSHQNAQSELDKLKNEIKDTPIIITQINGEKIIAQILKISPDNKIITVKLSDKDTDYSKEDLTKNNNSTIKLIKIIKGKYKPKNINEFIGQLIITPRSDGSFSIGKITNISETNITVEFSNKDMKSISFSDFIKSNSGLQKIEKIKELEKQATFEGHPTISKELCEELSFDNRDLMGSDTNQNGSNFCSGHAVAALLEEQRCLSLLEDSNDRNTMLKECKENNISRSFVMAYGSSLNEFQLGNNIGGNTGQMLRRILKKEPLEVCLNKYGPDPFDTADGGEKFIKKLTKYYNSVQESKKCINSINFDKFDDEIENIIDASTILENLEKNTSLWTSVKNDSSINPVKNLKQKFDLLDNKKLYEIASKKSISYPQYLEEVLLYNCGKIPGSNRPLLSSKSNRKPQVITRKMEMMQKKVFDPDNTKLKNKNFYFGQHFDAIREAKKYGRSMEASICYSHFVKKFELNSGISAKELSPSDKCGKHAVVFNAIKYENDRCMIHIKNSHGPNTYLKSGFYDLRDTLEMTYSFTFLRP